MIVTIRKWEDYYTKLEHIDVNGWEFTKQHPCYELLAALLDGKSKICFQVMPYGENGERLPLDPLED